MSNWISLPSLVVLVVLLVLIARYIGTTMDLLNGAL